MTVLGATSVVGFEQDDDEVRVTLKNGGAERVVRCEYLVGADGPRSSVRRQLGVGAFATYVTLQDFCRIEGPIEPYFDCIYMRDIGDSFGYAYVVPKGDVAIVGSVFYPKTKRPHEKHDQVIALLKETLPLGECVKREAWVALSVRHPERRGSRAWAACCSPARRAASCRRRPARASPTRSTPGGSPATRSPQSGSGDGARRLRGSDAPHRAQHRAQAEVAAVHGVAGRQVPRRLRADPIVSRITKGL